MASKHLRTDFNFAYPTAEIAVMGPEGAVNILYRRELAEAADPVAERAQARRPSSARSSPIRSSRPRAGSSTRSSSRARHARQAHRGAGQLRRTSASTATRPQEARQHPAADAARESSHRQPRRDRRPRHPRLPRDGLRRRRRLFRTAIARALHVRLADEAYRIGAEPGRRELPAHRPDRRRRATRRAPRSCIPGYGFLAENEDFAQACRDAGLTFIGPTPEAIALMGSKTGARDVARARRRARGARHRRAVRRRRARRRHAAEAAARSAIRSRQGGRRRRRQGHAHGRRGPTICWRRFGPRGRRPASAFGDRRVYLERRLDQPAAHRDPAARRSPRHRAAVRRARVFDPAAPPEGRRGVAVAGRSTRRRATRWPSARPRDRTRGRLHQRGHDRVPARRRRARSTSSR